MTSFREGDVMGTNYYVIKDKCECCKRGKREYHIGKSSYGWAFAFKGYPWNKLISWKAWKEFLKNQYIEDECGNKIPYDDFVQMVEQYKAPGFCNENGRVNLQHNDEGKKSGWFNPEMDWDDEDGYSFTLWDFS